MKNSISLFTLAVLVSACNGGSQAPQAFDATTSTSPIVGAPNDPVSNPGTNQDPSDPSPQPSPSPSASPTLAMFNVIENDQTVFNICTAFENWNSEDTTIQLNYTGYYYSFSSTGVSVTYSVGPYAGQTLGVPAQTVLTYGASLADGCTVTVQNSAVQSIVPNQGAGV
jgi:hypothetical protein